MIEVERIREAVRDCMITEEEEKALGSGVAAVDVMMVDGIVRQFGLHVGRLETHRAEVAGWLSELPVVFREDVGGGWSFLQACVDKDGHQWGEHVDMEMLFVLGVGLGLAKSLFPRDMWPALPGGMPYYAVLKAAYQTEPATQGP